MQQMNGTDLGSIRISVDGQSIYARVSDRPVPDERPAIVLVHGLVVAGDYMVPTAHYLREDFKVFIPDLPGFGKSDKPSKALDVPELADALVNWMTAVGLERAVLIGNSFGCQISVDAANRYPDRILGIVLAGPTIDPQHRSAPQQVGRWLLDGLNEPPSLGPILLRDYLAAGLTRAIRTFRYCLRDPIEEKLPHVQVPALVVRGAYDPIVPQQWAEEAVNLLPQGKLAVIPGVGHTLNYNAPLELARVSRLFLANLNTS